MAETADFASHVQFAEIGLHATDTSHNLVVIEAFSARDCGCGIRPGFQLVKFGFGEFNRRRFGGKSASSLGQLADLALTEEKSANL